MRTFSASTDSASPDSPPSDHPTRNIPGETYIGENETAGLPGTDIEAYSQQQATQVVQAHRRRFLSRFAPRSRSQSPSREVRHRRRRTFQSSDVDTDAETDVEHAGESRASAPPPRPGPSILSTLLSLYDTSGGTSPSSLRRTHSFESSRPASLYETNTHESGFEHHQDAHANAPASSEKSGKKWKVKLPFKHHHSKSSPTTARPGVFAPLIASTSNLSGAAAPTPSTIAPSIQRPGYHLSRYDRHTQPLSGSLTPACRYSTDATIVKGIEQAEDEELLRRPPSAYFDRLSTSSSTLGGTGTSPTTPTETTPPHKGGGRQKWTAVLKDLPKSTWSRAGTPTASTPGSPMTDTDEWISGRDLEKLQEKKERKRRRKKAEIYVSRFRLVS